MRFSIEGSCIADENFCIQSREYPAVAITDDSCTITILTSTVVDSDNFEIDEMDILEFNNEAVKYRSELPHILQEGDTIFWVANNRTMSNPWKFCFRPVTYDRTSHSPSIVPTNFEERKLNFRLDFYERCKE